MKTSTLMQDLKQLLVKNARNTRAYKEFGCPATPAPTPPGTDRSTRKAGVGAGFLNNQVAAGAGLEGLGVKTKDEHRGKPPVVSLMGRAGFSTPFPEGIPFGDLYLSTSIQGGRIWRTVEKLTVGLQARIVSCRKGR